MTITRITSVPPSLCGSRLKMIVVYVEGIIFISLKKESDLCETLGRDTPDESREECEENLAPKHSASSPQID